MPDTSDKMTRVYKGFGYAKTLIFGEYAVMHGAPGLVMAMPQRLTLSILPQCLDTPRTSSFLQELQVQLVGRFGVCGRVEIDDHAFFDDSDVKLGIGSSAAGVVALCIAVARAKNDSNVDILRQAIQVHRELQDGLGSGADIHASVLGGIHLVWDCPDNPQYQQVMPEVLPKIAVLAAHQPSRTREFLKAAQKVASSHRYRSAIGALAECYGALAQDVKSANKNAFLEHIAQVPALIPLLEHAIGMQILPDGFDRIAAIGKEHGVVVKTSGAGGGDILLALAQDRSAIDQFLDVVTQDYHLTPLDCEPPPVRDLKWLC